MIKRIDFFDIAKFIGMMMIVLGHFGVPDINTFVYTFHIPMFFLISGYFFYPREKQKEFVYKKFVQLIIPYLLVMFFVIFINIIILICKGEGGVAIARSSFKCFISYLYGSGYNENFFGYHIRNVGPIWYCLALFWNFLILNFLLTCKALSQAKLSIILGILFILGYVSAKYFWLPLSIQSALTSVSFVYLGFLSKKINLFSKNVQIGTILPLLCMWGLCMSYNGSFLFVTNSSVFVITDLITAVAASYLVILFCKWLENNTQIAKKMAFLGKYTLVMLCFHSIDIDIMPWNSYFLKENANLTIVFAKILLTLFKLAFPIIGIYIVLKIKFLKKIFQIKN